MGARAFVVWRAVTAATGGVRRVVGVGRGGPRARVKVGFKIGVAVREVGVGVGVHFAGAVFFDQREGHVFTWGRGAGA